MTIAQSPKTATLPKSLAYIAQRLEMNRQLTPAQMTRIIKDAKVQPEDLQLWADFAHPVQDSYGRKLVHKGAHFEIMVMSWCPGDFSAIHDHGHAQWGAVQIFGPAEHATFRIENNRLSTLARWQVTPGDVIGVSHSLIHQMGNPTDDTYFLSLHVYGDVISQKSVTGDARIFDPLNSTIQRVDGGVFFALPKTAIKAVEPGPVADYPTRLRHLVELIRRWRKIHQAGDTSAGKKVQTLIDSLFAKIQITAFNKSLEWHDSNNNAVFMNSMLREVRAVIELQAEIFGDKRTNDKHIDFQKLYRRLDSINLTPSFN